MSVSLEPVDAPETVEYQTNPLVTPTQIEESESNSIIHPKGDAGKWVHELQPDVRHPEI